MNSVQISGEDVEGREDPFAQQMRDGGASEGLIVIYANSMQNHEKKKNLGHWNSVTHTSKSLACFLALFWTMPTSIITNSFLTCFWELV